VEAGFRHRFAAQARGGLQNRPDIPSLHYLLMKKPIYVAAALALGVSVAAAAADWFAPQDPFAVYGNTYYVGTGGIGAVLITSPSGHILIDGGPTGASGQIAEHVRRLGFKVEDIRYILNGHEHFDHAGGIAELQKMSGATVLASPASEAVLRTGQPDKRDAQYPGLQPMTPVANTRTVRDGEVVRLGPLAVTAHFTPGHTLGATSWTWQSSEGGKTMHMVYGDSVNGIAAEGRSFSRNPLYPNARADVERSIATVESLDCDVLVSAHPELSGLWEKKAKQAELGNAAFVDRDGCRKYAAKARAVLAKTLAAEVPSAPVAYLLDDTEVRDVHARTLNRDYQVFIALPESYRSSNRDYPVLFVTDAAYGFPVARSIAQRLAKHAGLEEAIVVGLSYAKGDSAVFSRRRDYTPSVPRTQAYVPDTPGRAVAFGEAQAYGDFVANDVFPLIAAHYRADMRRKIFVGHSYGSLLGLQMLLTQPARFEHYILGSPSLWFDRGVMFDRENAYAKGHKDLPASVYFGIGGRETLAAGKKRSRTEEDADMLADLREFDAALKSHRYAGLKTRLEVFTDEDHASVFPLVLTHGLRAYLKKAR
jgi:predicted alpha/beta superfamily hydrolase/glyoxylase-like metal-dependent hydrolase (beta-lactamase superfamily II)